jgi:acyl carrier protein
MCVREIISVETGIPVKELSAITRLDSLGLDSLEFVDLMVTLGITADKMANLYTIGDVEKLFANLPA